MGTKNIREFGRNPPKYGGFQGGLAKCRSPATFRSAPWRSAVFRGEAFLFSNYVFRHPTNLVLGKGYRVPRNHFRNSGGICQNTAGSIDVYLSPGVLSLCVALRCVSRDWCRLSTLLARSVLLCVPGVSDSRYPITSARSGKCNRADFSLNEGRHGTIFRAVSLLPVIAPTRYRLPNFCAGRRKFA